MSGSLTAQVSTASEVRHQQFVEVCASDDLWEGEMECFDVGRHKVLVVNVDGELHAYDGICPHQSVSLEEGVLEGKVLTCRAHQWTFDVSSGKSMNPAGERLRRFPIRVVDGMVSVAGDPESD